MEDKIIFKGQFCYQFRLDMIYQQYVMHLTDGQDNHYISSYEVDEYETDIDDLEVCARFRFYQEKIPHTIDLGTPLGRLHEKHTVRINRFLELFTHYLVCLESSSQDKVHYQAILWTKEPLELSTTLDKIKQKYFPLQKTKFKQNSVSLTQAKNIKNLGSYVKKDKHIVKTNMTESQIAMLPQWKTKENLKKEWNNKLIKKIEECNLDGLTARQTADILVQYSWDNERMQPTRARMQYLLGRHHNNYSSENIVIGYRLFPDM
jgi:hypothetical protein